MSTPMYKSIDVRHNLGVERSSFIIITGFNGETAKVISGPTLASGPMACVVALAPSPEAAAEVISEDGAVYVATDGTIAPNSTEPASPSEAAMIPPSTIWFAMSNRIRTTTIGTAYIMQRQVSAGPEQFETTRLLFVEGTTTSRVKWQVKINGVWTDQPDMATIGTYHEIVAELPNGPVVISNELSIASNPAMVALQERFLKVLVPATL